VEYRRIREIEVRKFIEVVEPAAEVDPVADEIEKEENLIW